MNRRSIAWASVIAVALLAEHSAAQGWFAEFEGKAFADAFGASVSRIGDADGDGYDDMVIGAYLEDGNGVDSGVVRVLSGKSGAPLLVLTGPAAGVSLGRGVSDAGDVNADGTPDLVVASSSGVIVFSGLDGAILYQVPTGSTPIVTGAGDMNADGYADVAFVQPVGGTGATVVSGKTGATGTFPGIAFGVSDLGDVDGDGFDDLIVGFPGVTVGTPGTIDVYSGRNGSLLRQVQEGTGESIGYHVSGVSDVDGDGVPDILASLDNEMAAIYSGQTALALHVLLGDTGVGLPRFGDALDSAGDLDGDGRGDVIVGAPGLFLAETGYARAFSGASGAELFTVRGGGLPTSIDSLGASVAGVGDMNQDGLADVLVGAPQSPLANATGPGFARVFSFCGGSRVQLYGKGCPGSGGFVPELRVFGCPTPGLGLDVAIEDALGGSIALIVVGLGADETPIAGTCTLYVSQRLPSLIPVPIAPGPPGGGFATITLRVPASQPSGSRFLQAFVQDGAAFGGFAATNAVEVSLP